MPQWLKGPRPASARSMKLLLLIGAVALLAAGCGRVTKPHGWAAPVIHDDVVYASHESGKVSAYRLATNGRIWEFPGQGVSFNLTGLYGNPVLRDDTLYIGGYGGNIAALAAPDGGERWRHKAGARVIGGVLVTADTVYTGVDSGDLVALDRATGNERWRKKVANQIFAAPVSDGTSIFIAGMDGRVTAFNPDGTQRWREKVADGAIAGTPALKDGMLYLGSYDKHLYAVDAATGATRWRSDLTAGNWFWTEPLLDGDNLYAGSLDGHVYALDRQSGAQRWSSEKLGGQLRARMALVNGVLVTPSGDGQLYGLKPADGAQQWPAVAVGGKLFADLTSEGSALYLSAETGKTSHKLFKVDATANAGSVTEIPLNN